MGILPIKKIVKTEYTDCPKVEPKKIKEDRPKIYIPKEDDNNDVLRQKWNRT